MKQTKHKTFKLKHILSTLLSIALIVGALVLLRSSLRAIGTLGTSAEPTIHPYEEVLLDTWTYRFHPPARGDYIAFWAPPQPRSIYGKRIIGIPGDTITIDNTTVILDGVTLNEWYVRYQGNPNRQKFEQITLPSTCACYFVMGDNRADSFDSRAWGTVPRANIIGKYTLIIGPPSANNLGYLGDVSAVFAGIHPQTTRAVPNHAAAAALLRGFSGMVESRQTTIQKKGGGAGYL